MNRTNSKKGAGPASIQNIPAEEMKKFREEKNKYRDEYVKKAVAKGASVNYVSMPLTLDDQESIVCFGNDAKAPVTIDTTIQNTMNRCIDCGYKIVRVTYLKDASGEALRVVGLTFETSKNKISFRK